MLISNGSKEDSIQVLTDDQGAAYVNVAAIQLPQVQVLLDGFGIPYAVENKVPESGDDNCTVAIKLGPEVSIDEVQQSLDVLD